MLIDITLKITPEIANDPVHSEPSLVGHLGTHFDVMNKDFPLEYTKRKGIAFDVSGITDRDIDICDISLDNVEEDTFVAFYSGYIEKVNYGENGYFTNHPQLSYDLIEALLEKGVSIIGLDFAGIRRGKEHTPTDQYCADKGTFIIENLCNLKKLLGRDFIANTYPMNYVGITGLPCRVIAEIE
ncbi:MAG: cyclase family protein [Clostridia bacterium]|nr:cyclase family protein [Clostridia bacterium]